MLGYSTATEVIRAAGLDWEVAKMPLFRRCGRAYRGINKLAVMRVDQLSSRDAPVLGIVSENYQLLQNREAFAWFDRIVADSGAKYESAGMVGAGERIWILARMAGELRIAGDDRVQRFLLLSNSHDGESSVQVKFTPIRVSCQNTLTIALNRGPKLLILHDIRLQKLMDEARRNLNSITNNFESLEQRFQSFASVLVDGNRLSDFLLQVWPEPTYLDAEASKVKKEEARLETARLFEEGPRNVVPRLRGTLWAAYNAVAEYVDHHQTYRDGRTRLEAIWFVECYRTKAKAFKVALEKLTLWRN